MQHKNAEYFKRIIAFIDDYAANYGSSPSVREISNGTGLSTATVSRYCSGNESKRRAGL